MGKAGEEMTKLTDCPYCYNNIPGCPIKVISLNPPRCFECGRIIHDKKPDDKWFYMASKNVTLARIRFLKTRRQWERLVRK